MSARIEPIYVWLQYLVSFVLLAYTLGSSAFLIRRWRRNPHEKPLAGTRTYIYTCIVVEFLGLIALIHNLVNWHGSLRYDANWLFWTNVFYYCAMPSAPTALLFSAIHKCALSFFPHLTAPTFEKVVKLERVTLACIPLAQFVIIVIQDAPRSWITVCYDFECLLRHGQGQTLKLWIYFLADLYLITIAMVLLFVCVPKSYHSQSQINTLTGYFKDCLA
uniref:G protein-coupled receptor n=1 Tax=Panagrellus redivivus TaxID=6233 RepID=A0A7E4WD89_PANRE